MEFPKDCVRDAQGTNKNLQDIRHRNSRMMCKLRGIAAGTSAESCNFQRIRHRDGRMVYNLQKMCGERPWDCGHLSNQAGNAGNP